VKLSGIEDYARGGSKFFDSTFGANIDKSESYHGDTNVITCTGDFRGR
jgi:hypothetical protein